MKSYVKKIGFILMVCMVWALPAHGSAGDASVVEGNLTTIGQETLDKVFGEGKFVVRVRAQLSESSYSVKYTKQATPQGIPEKKAGDKVYILPGVPAIKNISPDRLNTLPFDSVTNLASSRLVRIGVTLIANKKVSNRQVTQAENLLKEVIDFKEGRDLFQKKKQEFYIEPENKTVQKIKILPADMQFITPQNVFYAIFAVLMLIFIIVFMSLLKQQIAKSESSKGASSISVTAGGGMGSDSKKEESSKIELTEASKIKRYFDFIDRRNIDNFLYLLKKEQISTEYVAMIISFLDPELSAKVVEALPETDRVKVTQELMDQRLSNKEVLDRLEKKLQSALECFVGGKSKVKNIFELLSSNDRKWVLDSLRESGDVEMYQKFREVVLVFEDIMVLTDAELKRVLSDINLDLLAKALLSVDQDVYNRIEENLNNSAKAIVKQYMELKAETTSRLETEEAQEYILRVLKALDKAGNINLQEKLI